MRFLPIGTHPDLDVNSLATSMLLEQMFEKSNSRPIIKYNNNGYTDKSIDDFAKLINDLGGVLFMEEVATNSVTLLYRWNGDIFLSVYLKKNRSCSVEIVGNDKEFIEKLKTEITKLLSGSPTKQGYVFAVAKNTQGSLELTRIGYAGSKLERGNYTEEVLKDYDFMIKDLQSKTPSGRISVLNGIPGSGKTFLIRSILMDAPDSLFVIVPPDMVSSLSGPDLLPLLLKNKEDYRKKGSTVLILEDADACLVPRQGDNMSSISALLNLGDGVLGSLFDIRIIATTNAKKLEMDKAIMRPGRLSRHITVDELDYKKANEVYKRLVGNNKNLPREETTVGFRTVSNDKYSLASVYQMAREAGWEPPPIVVQEDDFDDDFGFKW